MITADPRQEIRPSAVARSTDDIESHGPPRDHVGWALHGDDGVGEFPPTDWQDQPAPTARELTLVTRQPAQTQPDDASLGAVLRERSAAGLTLLLMGFRVPPAPIRPPADAERIHGGRGQLQHFGQRLPAFCIESL